MRRAKIEDVPTLLKLARMVYFINLPADKDIINDKAQWSRQCFVKAARPGDDTSSADEESDHHAAVSSLAAADDSGLAAITTRSDLYMFVLEDTESGGVLGTSQVVAHMGGPGHPNVSFELVRTEMFSKSLQQGATHTVAKLCLDETGPTELGGLILQPSYRGHKAKLGRFLSLIRFHFMALHRAKFSDRVIAELMAPITADGRSTLWEYLGRRFINLTYTEADRFCQYTKEFIISLLPREGIYLTLLPPEARSVIGQVGPETLPARRMLERLGFKHNGHVDPFDGGPSLEAKTSEISIIKNTRRTSLGEAARAQDCRSHGIVSTLDTNGEFRALEIGYMLDGAGHARIAQEHMTALEAKAGTEIGLTPMDTGASDAKKERGAVDAKGSEGSGAMNGTATKGSKSPAKPEVKKRMASAGGWKGAKKSGGGKAR